AILWQLRAPRVVLGALVGGMLALAGGAYQGVFRNPLVDPYLLGVAAGAGLGATLAIAYGGGAVDSYDLLPLAAFLGAALGVVLATVGTAAAVAVSGLIGFVGIIVPHAIRLGVGTSYRIVLPLSLLVGGGFLVFADVLARTVISPAELPIGVVTAFFGAPFFA